MGHSVKKLSWLSAPCGREMFPSLICGSQMTRFSPSGHVFRERMARAPQQNFMQFSHIFRCVRGKCPVVLRASFMLLFHQSFTACGALCVTFQVGLDFKKLDRYEYIQVWCGRNGKLLTGNMLDKGFRVKDLHACVTFMLYVRVQYPSLRRSSLQGLHGSLFMYTYTQCLLYHDEMTRQHFMPPNPSSFSPYRPSSDAGKGLESSSAWSNNKTWLDWCYCLVNRSGVGLPPMCSLGLQENPKVITECRWCCTFWQRAAEQKSDPENLQM